MPDSLPAPAGAILEAVGLVLAERAADSDHALAELKRWCEGEIAERIDALPAPLPGAPGRDGSDGRDGTDRVLALPRYVREGESCEANTIAWANAGIWQSVRVTSGGPADDPSGWRCLVPGVAAIETSEDWARRELVIGLRMSDGQLHECRGRMPATLLPPDYRARGWGVLAGDTVRPVPDQPGDEMELLALVDGADIDRPDHWRATRLRGFRGQKGPRGDPGERGPPGPGLAGLDMVRAGGRLALVPRFADPKVTADPIAVDLLTDDPEPGLAPIAGWAGPWNAARTYRRGEVVNAQIAGHARLCLSMKSDNAARPDDASAWQVML